MSIIQKSSYQFQYEYCQFCLSIFSYQCIVHLCFKVCFGPFLMTIKIKYGKTLSQYQKAEIQYCNEVNDVYLWRWLDGRPCSCLPLPSTVLVINSILFSWLYTIKDQREKFVLSHKSRFAPVVFSTESWDLPAWSDRPDTDPNISEVP